MTCCKVCGRALHGETTCPACGAHVVNNATRNMSSRDNIEEIADENVSVFMKYADLLDNNVLFKAAICKLNGISVEKNVDEAMEILKVLAFRGHLEAMDKFAECLMEQDVSNIEVACKWWSLAAEEGHAPSKRRLKMLNREVISFSEKQHTLSVEPGLEVAVREVLPCVLTIEAGQRGSIVGMQGSGFILEGGFVVTNAHVVGSDPDYIVAHFEPSISTIPHKLEPVEICKKYDIAILRFSGLADEKFSARENLHLRVGALEYGESVYTIGNPLGSGISVSKGIISCPNRDSRIYRDYAAVGEVIQTDITINHGNSGGALFDMNNNVIGIATFHPTASEGGMSMCIPASCIVTVLNKLENKKR